MNSCRQRLARNLGIFAAGASLLREAEQQRTHLDDLSQFSPISPLRVLRPNPDLEICFDTRTRNAVYVQHRVTIDGISNGRRGRHRFKEDTQIEEQYRSRNSYYHLTGYDRGHLAPAADFAQQEDTFNLCNVAPQNPDMNRRIWSWLEELTRQVARKAWQENEAVTYVTTGPLWMPSIQVADKIFRYNVLGIGHPPTLVMVPTHFFKVVVVVDKDHRRILQFACFVIPNSASANDKSLDAYAVPWTDLETVTGLTFYPTLADDTFKAMADASTIRALPSGSQLLLTDGGKSKRQPKTRIQDLQHLCEDQACLLVKQRQ
jgi:DNA/RNA endonuclease G (NUC1)